MVIERPKQTPDFAPLDPLDWNTEDLILHLQQDVSMMREKLQLAILNHNTDKLLDDIQNFHGRVRSWLRLYAIVTKQEITPINM